MTQRTQEIFASPGRALTIASTEASRSLHAGQYEQAKDSGEVRGMRWLCSSDACDQCKELCGTEAAFEEPFYVDPKGGPYARVYHPPRH